MARLPDYTTLGSRPSVQDRGGIATKRTGQASAALVQFGEEVQAVGSALQQRENRLVLAKARSTLLQEDIKARADLENDNDYGTFEQRYTDRMTDARSKLASTITSSSDRQIFEMESQVDFERGKTAVMAKARAKEVDFNRASLAETLEANRTSALNATDTESRQAFIEASNDAIRGAAEQGYITEQESATYRQKWTQDFAEASVLMLDPEDRIKALEDKEGVARHIAPDKRKALLDAAKKENDEVNTRAEAQMATDRIVASGKPLKEQLAEARKIEDPAVRDSVVTRLKQRSDEERAIENNAQVDALTQGYEVAANGGDWEDIPSSVVAAMDPKSRIDLKEYMKAGGNVQTDYKVWTDLRFKTVQELAAIDNPLEYRPFLNDADYKALVSSIEGARKAITSQNAAVASGVSVQTELSLVKSTAEQAGANNDKKMYQFTSSYDARVNQLMSELGREPTLNEKRKVLADLTKEVVLEDTFLWFDSSKPAWMFIDDIPETDRADIEYVLKLNGLPVTDEAIIDMYVKTYNMDEPKEKKGSAVVVPMPGVN